MNRYTVIKQLGDGTFGSVIMATDTDTGETVAIKKWVSFTLWDSLYFMLSPHFGLNPLIARILLNTQLHLLCLFIFQFLFNQSAYLPCLLHCSPGLPIIAKVTIGNYWNGTYDFVSGAQPTMSYHWMLFLCRPIFCAWPNQIISKTHLKSAVCRRQIRGARLCSWWLVLKQNIWFLRIAEARNSYRLDVRPSVRLSVRLSVCPSHAGTLSKRLNILSCFLHHTIAHSF